jgi:GxxExxY protein
MSDIEKIGKDIVHCAIKVHKALGPGLMESAYQKCLAYELEQLGHKVQCELLLPIEYGPVQIDAGYRVDMLIDDSVIVENKTVEALHPINEAQLLTYLRMKKLQLGYLLNWNVSLMKQGMKRMLNDYWPEKEEKKY